MLSTKWHIWYIGIFKGISYWAAYIVDRVTMNEYNRVYMVKFRSISSKLKKINPVCWKSLLALINDKILPIFSEYSFTKTNHVWIFNECNKL